MSKVVSLRLRDDQAERLARAARRLGRSPTETAALLLEEALRQREFALIQFRDSPVGRQAYLQGSRLAIWQVVAWIREANGELEPVAKGLEVPLAYVAAAQRYAERYSEEIEAAIADSTQTADQLAQLIPLLGVVEVDAATP